MWNTLRRVEHWLLADGPVWQLLLISLGLGLAQVFLLFDAEFIVGTSEYWTVVGEVPSTGGGDRVTNLTGLLFFIQDEWHYPLLHTRLQGEPPGTNIIFTDSLPLLALGAKLLRGLLPLGSHYYGLWYVLCHLLQGVAASAALIAAGRRDRASTICAAVMALASPIFVNRFGHTALSGHFLLLFGIAAYLASVRRASFGRTCVTFGGLLVVALLVHFYLFASLLALFTATLVQTLLQNRQATKSVVLRASAVLLVLLAVFEVAGYRSAMAASAGVAAFGYGFYSLNLLGPLWPGRSGLFPFVGPAVDATGGQWFEGYSYLGFGLIVLLAAGMVRFRLELKGLVEKHVALAIVALLLVLFAISNVVTAGPFVLFDLPLPDFLKPLTGGLRSSGRFCWLPVYLGLVLGTILSAKLSTPRQRLALLFTCAVLQFADASQLRERIRRDSRTPLAARLASEHFSALVGEHTRVLVDPTWNRSWTRRLLGLASQLERIAALRGRPINSVRTSHALPHRDLRIPPLLLDKAEPGVLYVFWDDKGARAFSLFARPDQCLQFASGIACSDRISALSRQGPPPGFQLFDPTSFTLEHQHLVDGAQESGARFLGAGWHDAVKGWRPLTGEAADLVFLTNLDKTADFKVTLEIYAAKKETLRVETGTQKPVILNLKAGQQSVTIPMAPLSGTPPHRIHLRFHLRESQSACNQRSAFVAFRRFGIN